MARKYGRLAGPASSIIGVADGSIIAVIMTAHIAQSSNRCGASHCGVIVHALAPDIGPYMSRAITTIQAQHTSGTTISETMRAKERVCICAPRIVDRLDSPALPARLSAMNREEGRCQHGG